eukprot:5645208-Prymnesium_polylepis.2
MPHSRVEHARVAHANRVHKLLAIVLAVPHGQTTSGVGVIRGQPQHERAVHVGAVDVARQVRLVLARHVARDEALQPHELPRRALRLCVRMQVVVPTGEGRIALGQDIARGGHHRATLGEVHLAGGDAVRVLHEARQRPVVFAVRCVGVVHLLRRERAADRVERPLKLTRRHRATDDAVP